jgi:drug/metabolite transporter (DMT)-like permease
MLKRGSAARASANFYLVPGVAALLAWLLLGETLSPLAILGLVVSSVGCWLVNWRPGLTRHASAGTSSSSPSPR